MKNLFILFLFAFGPSSFLFSQQAELAPGGGTSCSADCLFTSCTITCTYPNGGGLCTCAWGFASCACGGGGATSAAQLEVNYAALERQEVDLKNLGENELASMIGNISRTAQRGGEITNLIKEYQAKADRLPSDKKARVSALTEHQH